ncbi:tubulin polyglutamylase complex subunit 1-like [Saccoglossus kowalevskii]|uniref:Tubulin polyglutamylase complex subunit 1-like n=1 Tax=Saccoglossus kowalevskii TaxID=10224 RepID=A0ABM0GPL5_SACKO|nr:PREDICTED: tubulin polyglutamylase complex subunit 1-like [Saccoglossus kowalevskii]
MAARLRDADRPESNREFLERTNVSSQIRDALSKMIENRPEDPVLYLAEYFEGISDNKPSKVTKAYQRILLTHYTRPAFETNAVAAYDTLCTQSGIKGCNGLTGSVYTELLAMLSRDISSVISEKLLKKTQCRDYEVVPYDVYFSGVLACLVLKDYIKEAQSLFNEFDISKSGHANRELCDAALNLLDESVTMTTSNPVSILEAGVKLSPDKLCRLLSQSVSVKQRNTSTITWEEFMLISADIFLKKVPSTTRCLKDVPLVSSFKE